MLFMFSEVMALHKFLEPNRCLILTMESGVCNSYQFQLTAKIKTLLYNFMILTMDSFVSATFDGL